MTWPERRTSGLFVMSTVAALVFAVGYWADGPTWVLGLGLGVALAAFGGGLVSWADTVDTGPEAVEERHPLEPSTGERGEVAVSINRGTAALGRRRVILASLGGAVLALGAALASPLRSLGPAPVRDRSTPWRSGRRLVTGDGQPIAAATMTSGGLVTAFPEGAVDAGDGPIVVVSLPADRLTSRTVDGGALDGIVAYSKVCTHAGCAVGLFQADGRPPDTIYRLLCPCHQSLFDPLDGAEPIGGPATRPLPQLPLAVDDDGHLVATGDFPFPVGPASWRWP